MMNDELSEVYKDSINDLVYITEYIKHYLDENDVSEETLAFIDHFSVIINNLLMKKLELIRNLEK